MAVIIILLVIIIYKVCVEAVEGERIENTDLCCVFSAIYFQYSAVRVIVYGQVFLLRNELSKHSL